MQMQNFVQALILDGKVLVEPAPRIFAPEERENATIILQEFYDNDRLHMPGEAPAFHKEAALWGAVFVYGVIQFMAVRQLEAEQFEAFYPAFAHPADAAAIYSADLCLRHLPQLYHFAQKLSPDDDLLQKIMVIATQWPFSSVGIRLDPLPDTAVILQHPSLKIAYIDRIFEKKDAGRLHDPSTEAAAREALGSLWYSLAPPLMKEMTV